MCVEATVSTTMVAYTEGDKVVLSLMDHRTVLDRSEAIHLARMLMAFPTDGKKGEGEWISSLEKRPAPGSLLVMTEAPGYLVINAPHELLDVRLAPIESARLANILLSLLFLEGPFEEGGQ